MSSNGIEFAKRVGIVCGAMLATGALVSALYTTATRPIMEAIADEREARIVADSMLASRLSGLSRDRIALLSVMEHPPGSRARDSELRHLRREWAAEEQERGR